METADITTIMDNDCQQRVAVGAAIMVMVGSDLVAKTTNQRICVEILLS
jgi:hypothetical protein